MARDAEIDARLRRWAAWVSVGDGSGYPAMCVIHPEWQPPSPGTTPTLKTSPASDVRQTRDAIATLSLRLRNTLVVVYGRNLSLADQAAALQCAESTVVARVDLAHQLLRAEFCKKLEPG
jgi:DNA-directed RNA polymerase specialized sigma24 family protein